MSDLLYRRTANIFSTLVKLNFKRGEVTLPDIGTARTRSEIWGHSWGVFPRDSTLRSGTPVRESAAPPPGTSVRVPQIGPRIASKPILGRCVTQPLILSVSQESALLACNSRKSRFARPSRRGFVLTTNSKEAFRSRFNDHSTEDSLHIRNWRLQIPIAKRLEYSLFLTSVIHFKYLNLVIIFLDSCI